MTTGDRIEPREETTVADEQGSAAVGVMDTFVALVERGVAEPKVVLAHRPVGHINTVASRVVQGGVAAQIESQSQTSSSDPIHHDHPVNLAVVSWGSFTSG